jgi:hypothetical protein
MGGIFIIMIIKAYRETLPVAKVTRYQIRANDTIWDPKMEKLWPINMPRYWEYFFFILVLRFVSGALGLEVMEVDMVLDLRHISS